MSSEFKKKKLVVPAVTLLVAVAMMMGVGYAALTSTFEKTSSSTEASEFSVSVDGSGDTYIFQGVKIPYSVNVKDSTTTYSLDSEYVLCENKTVTITDGSGKYSSYTITVTVSSANLGSLGTLTGSIIQGNDAVTSITSTTGLSLKVIFKPTGTTISESDIAKLSASDIDIKISVTGVPS